MCMILILSLVNVFLQRSIQFIMQLYGRFLAWRFIRQSCHQFLYVLESDFTTGNVLESSFVPSGALQL